MKLIFQILTMALLLSVFAQQSGKNYAGMTSSQLIDEFVTIDSPGVGFHPTAWASAFVAEDAPARFSGGILGSQAPTIHPAFKELVKRGAACLPDLIKGLSDKRETKLNVGGKSFMFQYFGDEYDPKQRKSGIPRIEGNITNLRERGFSGQYTIKVGDICYAAIGQIVNRSLNPIRYQPTAGLVVNSPIETPELIKRTTADWSNTRENVLKLSLTTDLEAAESPFWAVPAIKRLRHYFPQEYQRLKSGKLSEKIQQAEKEESR